MLKDFRNFEAGPDPTGKIWRVELRWLQTAISIRHSDSVDVKFWISSGETAGEKVVALMHSDLLELSAATGRPLEDSWCLKLAAVHLKHAIETGEDFEKTILTPSLAQLKSYQAALSGAHATR